MGDRQIKYRYIVIHRIASVMSFIFYRQMFSGRSLVIVRSVLELWQWFLGTRIALPEYPKTTPRHPVFVFDGFVTDCFESLIDTAGCPT